MHRKVLKRQPRCRLQYPGICTGVSTQVDHIREKDQGGTNAESNLQGVCQPCHDHKSGRYAQAKSMITRVAKSYKRQPERRPNAID